MLISPDQYQRLFAGYRVTGCAVRSRSVLYLVAQSYRELDADSADDPAQDARVLTKVIVYFADKPEQDRWKSVTFKGFDSLIAGVAAHPLEQFVGVDADGHVVSMGSGEKTHESRIPGGPLGPRRGGIRKTKTLDGYLFACSGYRGLGRRDAESQWVTLCDTLSFEPAGSSLNYGFDDFDAFPDGEMYAVGGKSDVWRLRGGRWEPLAFPSGHPLSTVCCGKDGRVYIGTGHRAIFRGKGNEWSLIRSGNAWSTDPCRDLVWFRDRVYGIDGSQLIEISGGEVQSVDVPPDVRACCNHLAVGDTVMLVASEMGAAFHDGSAWRVLFRRDPWKEDIVGIAGA